LEVADILIKSYYEHDCNEVADKRREVCHFLSRPGELNEKELTALKQELQVLLEKVANKGKAILDRTGYEVEIPGYFSKFPALQG
jgi:flagellar motility protein MotE (MotC chaperone)